MNDNKLSFTDYQIFLYKALFWLSLAWGGFLFAMSGFFYAPIIWILSIVFGSLMIRLTTKHGVNLKPSREMWIACLSIATIAIIFSCFSTPTIFSGRDQGAISEAAIRLSQNHALYFSTPGSDAFFQLHGQGRALNFPGFYYTASGSLITQFPLVYIVWLALFFSLFGIAGLTIANAVLLFLFLISFYLLIRLFLETWAAMPAMLFAVTSFVFMWFTKYTLSENMALPLLWMSILTLMLFLKNQRKLYYAALMATMILLCFTRVEGFAFLAISLIVIYCHEDTRNYVKENLLYRFFLPAGIFLLAFIANAIIDINFYRELAKAILPNIKQPQTQLLGSLNENALPALYTVKILFIYGLLGFFVFGIISIATYTWKKHIYKLVPFFITLPTFIYLFDSHISSDHPWMLRRYMFSLAPVTIFYSGLLIGEWLERKPSEKNAFAVKIFALIISIVLLAGNLPSFVNFLPYSENKNLLEQTKQFSGQFSSNDLVLIDQQATMDGWSMMTGPMSFLYGKNAVYFFNVQDLARLDLNKFSNVYLVAPSSQIPYYTNMMGPRLTKVNDYSLYFSKLNIQQNSTLESVNFPAKKDFTVDGEIFKISKQ